MNRKTRVVGWFLWFKFCEIGKVLMGIASIAAPVTALIFSLIWISKQPWGEVFSFALALIGAGMFAFLAIWSLVRDEIVDWITDNWEKADDKVDEVDDRRRDVKEL